MCKRAFKTFVFRSSIRSLDILTDMLVFKLKIPQHKLYTRKTELVLEMKVYLDFHRVYMAMATNTGQRQWRQIRVSHGGDFPAFVPTFRELLCSFSQVEHVLFACELMSLYTLWGFCSAQLGSCVKFSGLFRYSIQRFSASTQSCLYQKQE